MIFARDTASSFVNVWEVGTVNWISHQVWKHTLSDGPRNQVTIFYLLSVFIINSKIFYPKNLNKFYLLSLFTDYKWEEMELINLNFHVVSLGDVLGMSLSPCIQAILSLLQNWCWSETVDALPNAPIKLRLGDCYQIHAFTFE